MSRYTRDPGLSRYTHDEVEAEYTEAFVHGGLQSQRESLQSRQDRIEKTLHQVRESLEGLEGRLLPVLTAEASSPSVDKATQVEQHSNLAVWLVETLIHLQAVVDHIERLARRVDL